jgi:hypothetical protein
MNFCHHENGDSDFTFSVNMHVGCSDKQGSTVTIGSLLQYVICYYEEDKCYSIVDEDGWTIQSKLASKEACIEWLIKSLGGK